MKREIGLLIGLFAIFKLYAINTDTSKIVCIGSNTSISKASQVINTFSKINKVNSLGNSVNGYTIVVVGSFIINQNIDFIDCNIRMQPGAIMEVAQEVAKQ
jgi:hypothetical protein